MVGGLLIGCAIGGSTLVYAAIYPMLIGFNVVPKVAVAPVLVIWFDIGTAPAVITAFLPSFFPTVDTVEPELRDVLRALGAGLIDIIVKIGLPRARTSLVVALFDPDGLACWHDDHLALVGLIRARKTRARHHPHATPSAGPARWARPHPPSAKRLRSAIGFPRVTEPSCTPSPHGLPPGHDPAATVIVRLRTRSGRAARPSR